MKAPVLLLALLFSSLVAIAQQYKPFPLKNARWNTSSSSFSTTCFSSVYYDGDTIVNNFLYSKLYSNSICHDFNTNQYSGSNHYLIGMIREEGKRIYFFRSNKETLIYDFNLNVGDTLPNSDYKEQSIFSSSSHRFIIQKIDSIKLLDGIVRKRFICYHPNNSNFTNEIIEGVGATNLFHSIDPLPGPVFDLGDRLSCFSFSDSLVYSNNSSNTGCPLISPTTELGQQEIHLSSTVLSSPIQVTWDSGILNFSLFNTMGQLIYQIDNQHSPFVLERESLMSGIYFLKIQNKENQFKVYKILVE